MGTAVVELIDVSKSYAGTEGTPPMSVLKDVNLSVRTGEAIAIVGPSGSGKSTLLNLIGALDRPDTGRVVVDGLDLATLSDEELAAVRSRRIGFVFQLHHLLPQCTVLENVLVPTLARCARGPGHWAPSPAQSRERSELRARRLLERVGLSGRLGHRPGQLSGGERQRVAVVRALINEPKVLLADEPTGSLDRAAAENLAELLSELNREEGTALIVVTHAASLAEQMSRVLALEEGILVVREKEGV